MMTKEGSTKIVNYMTPWAGILALGCGHIDHIVKVHYSFKIFFFTPSHKSDKLTIYILAVWFWRRIPKGEKFTTIDNFDQVS